LQWTSQGPAFTHALHTAAPLFTTTSHCAHAYTPRLAGGVTAAGRTLHGWILTLLYARTLRGLPYALPLYLHTRLTHYTPRTLHTGIYLHTTPHTTHTPHTHTHTRTRFTAPHRTRCYAHAHCTHNSTLPHHTHTHAYAAAHRTCLQSVAHNSHMPPAQDFRFFCLPATPHIPTAALPLLPCSTPRLYLRPPSPTFYSTTIEP